MTDYKPGDEVERKQEVEQKTEFWQPMTVIDGPFVAAHCQCDAYLLRYGNGVVDLVSSLFMRPKPKPPEYEYLRQSHSADNPAYYWLRTRPEVSSYYRREVGKPETIEWVEE